MMVAHFLNWLWLVLKSFWLKLYILIALLKQNQHISQASDVIIHTNWLEVKNALIPASNRAHHFITVPGSLNYFNVYYTYTAPAEIPDRPTHFMLAAMLSPLYHVPKCSILYKWSQCPCGLTCLDYMLLCNTSLASLAHFLTTAHPNALWLWWSQHSNKHLVIL